MKNLSLKLILLVVIKNWSIHLLNNIMITMIVSQIYNNDDVFDDIYVVEEWLSAKKIAK